VLVRADVLRRGRRVVFLRAEATVDGAVVAAGQVTKTLVGGSG
jgi:acyl-coenzyme A thioesterase PaaI-like protein